VKKIIFITFLSVILTSVFLTISRGAGQPVQIDVNFPGATQASSTPGGMINNFYNFALMAGGILAFGVIVYGGIRYTMAGGNPSSAEEGKKWIQQAFWGLLLLFGAYIVLNTINPNLTSLSLPSLQAPEIAAPSGAGGGCPNCASLSAVGISCKDSQSCTAAVQEVAVLQCIIQKSAVAITVTEAFPPTVNHISQCHNNGCCVDVKITSFNNCSQVQAVVDAAQSCGAQKVANEYSNCGGATYDTTTGNNIHIQGC